MYEWGVRWAGHPGRLVKTWDPVVTPASWAPGRGVYNVTCSANDTSQAGWWYDPATAAVVLDRASGQSHLTCVPCRWCRT